MRWRTAWMAIGAGMIAAQAGRADDRPLAEYFRVETAKIAAKPLLRIDSADAWKTKRPELQRRLKAMLGLWPEPARGDLKVTITGTVERPDFVIEKLHYQSIPGLYVTANLYLPKSPDGRLPAILYVCGHSEVKKDGVIYGNKAHYQHHAAWYAANGYVCLIVDTLQLGEVPGLHHGTAREGMWWWQSRGYTPAGVEAWNAVRGIDYLLTRSDVDPQRIGVTGRSGGGATSWWVGAIDDRVAAVCAVAGITDLTNHVVSGNNKEYPDGVISGHCDCMYFVNTYRWDFDTLAALVAPKPLLVENTDVDPIFPLDGVKRIYAQLEKVYGWHGAGDKLGLVIGKGGHADTAELRHPSFAFFEKYLKGKESGKIEEPDRKVPVELLRVLPVGELPKDQKNSAIHETFVAAVEPPPVPRSAKEFEELRSRWIERVRNEVFAGWPDDFAFYPLDIKPAGDHVRDGVRMRAFDFTSQVGVRLRLWLFTAASKRKPVVTGLYVGNHAEYMGAYRQVIKAFEEGADPGPGADLFKTIRKHVPDGYCLALMMPRGSGPGAFPSAKEETHVRRRFALLGQTLDGMRVWDARRALEVLHTMDELDGSPFELSGERDGSILALWASAFEPNLAATRMIFAPATNREGPALLNIDRILDVPQAVTLHSMPVKVMDSGTERWRWSLDLLEILNPDAMPLEFPEL